VRGNGADDDLDGARCRRVSGWLGGRRCHTAEPANCSDCTRAFLTKRSCCPVDITQEPHQKLIIDRLSNDREQRQGARGRYRRGEAIDASGVGRGKKLHAGLDP
jgi:hypothetical protein